jgi:hypothetical protein
MKLLSFNEFLNESKSEEYEYLFGLDMDTLIYHLDYASLGLNHLDSKNGKKYINKIYSKLLDMIDDGSDVELYRIIWVKDEKDINKDKLGHHWAYDMEVFDNEWNIENLWNMNHEDGDEDTDLDYIDDLWLITIKTPISNINFKNTLWTNCRDPYEKEITLTKWDDIKIIDISKFHN